jgi:hypothetical protein
MNAERLNEVSGIVIDAAMQVHTVLGPGLLENAYKACLAPARRGGRDRGGLLINFNVTRLRDGIKQRVNNL